MRKLIAAIVLPAALFGAVATLAQPASEVVALTGGCVIPSPDATPIDDAVVVMSDVKILDVGRRAQVKIPPAARTIDCRGMFVVAGFQNNHVHFTEEKWANAKTQPATDLSTALRAMFTQYGFT